MALPLLYTGSYLTKNPGVGSLYVGAYTAAAGGQTVFDTLVNPPGAVGGQGGGTGALTKSLNWAKAKGTTAMTSPVKGDASYTPALVSALVKRNVDFIMLRYLEASIARSNGVPIL